MEHTNNKLQEHSFEVIENVSDYMKLIAVEIKALKSDLHRDEYLAFRGQSNVKYKLEPSLARPIPHRPDFQMLHFEKELIYAAQHEYPNEFMETKSPVELLIKLQHFGIPTRLLDITTNALVALFFSCCSSENADGEVFLFKLKRDYHWNDALTEFIADTYRFDLAEKSMEECFNAYRQQTYYIASDVDYLDEYYDFRNRLNYAHKNPTVVQPPRIFPRLNAQGGQFLLFTNDLCYGEENEIPTEIDEEIHWLPKQHSFIKKIFRVPNSAKSTILQELAVLGVTKSALFHDNIDMVCSEIVHSIDKRTQNRQI